MMAPRYVPSRKMYKFADKHANLIDPSLLALLQDRNKVFDLLLSYLSLFPEPQRFSG